MKNKSSGYFCLLILLPLIALTLAGCSTPSSGEMSADHPGLIQGKIPVEIIQYPVFVEAIDPAQRTIVLKRNDGTTKTFSLDESVKNLDQVKVGDKIKATVRAELSVYLLDHEMLPNADGTLRPKTANFNAQVLRVYPRDRLLMLQFTNGQRMTIKAGPGVMLDRMSPGDDAVMRANLITGITIK
jgi:hypothetical protein